MTFKFSIFCQKPERRKCTKSNKSRSITLLEKSQCSKFFSSVFSHIQIEYEDFPYKFPSSVRMRENKDQKNSEYRQVLHSASSDLLNFEIIICNYNFDNGKLNKTN